MKTPNWQEMSKRFYCLFLLVAVITSCSPENGTIPLNSGRTDVDILQQNFRREILSQYDQPVKEEIVIAAPVRQKVSEITSGSVSDELAAWRDEISKPWNQIPLEKFYMVCEILYEGIVDRESQLANYFVEVQNKFDRDGIKVNSMTDIELLQDNRKTIQFPTKDFSSSLITCSSRITLKMANGDITSPQISELAWNYYFDGSQIKNTISFTIRNN